MNNTVQYRKNRKLFLMFTIPALLLYLFALIVPLVIGTFPASFYRWNMMKAKKAFTGIENYKKLFMDRYFIKSIWFTFKLAVVTIAGSNLIAFFAAHILNGKVYFKSIGRALFFIPNVIGGVMVAFVWYFFFSNVIPGLAQQYGWEHLQTISWFGSGHYAFITIVVATIWHEAGFLMVLYVAGLQGISNDILEAARLDGCTGLKKIRHIELPLLMPTITINLFVSIAGAFKAYDIPNALTGGGPARASEVMAMNIYNDAFSTGEIGYACTKSVILFIFIMTITFVQLQLTRKREVQE